jgi:Patatin phospholipase
VAADIVGFRDAEEIERRRVRTNTCSVFLVCKTQRHYEGHSKDYAFSRPSMEEHWRAGYHDTVRTLRHPEVLERPRNQERVFTFDLAYDGRE